MSGKKDISMSAAEVDRFLRSKRDIIVAGGATGPVEGAAGILFYRAGVVSFGLDSSDPLIGLISADTRVCCVAEQFPSYYEIRGVMLHGHAKRVEATELITQDAGAGTLSADVVVFDLEIIKTISFDFAKLKA